MKCQNQQCQREIGDVLFCPYCGTRQEKPKLFCVYCGAEMDEDAVYCNNCGKKSYLVQLREQEEERQRQEAEAERQRQEAEAERKRQEAEAERQRQEAEAERKRLEEEKRNLVLTQDYESAALVRDKVIDLKKKLNLYTNIWEKNGGRPAKVVTGEDIERIISEMTGIPVEQMTASETERIEFTIDIAFVNDFDF